MDLEAPADSWYVFIGVAIFSVAVGGVVLGLPDEPPPDANQAANVIDEAAGSPYNASATYEHDADEYYVTNETIVLRNEGGKTSANLAYGPVIPVWPDVDIAGGDTLPERGPLKRILHGVPPGEIYDSPEDFRDAIKAHSDEIKESLNNENPPKWHIADGTVHVRTIHWDYVRVTLVDV